MNFQSIEPIQKLWTESPISGIQQDKTESEKDSLFSGIFQSMLDTVKETDAVKNEKEYLLAVGQLDNPAELTIAANQALASVTLMVQLRNKALDAYSEIMRISL